MISFCHFLSLSVMAAAFASAFKFPHDIERCLYSDSCCLSRVVTNILQTHYKGVPALNIPPIDPIHVKRMLIERVAGDLVDAEIRFKNLDIIGFRYADVQNLTGFTKEASDLVFTKYETLPQLTVTGRYSADGYMFNLPVKGRGNGKIIFENILIFAKSKCSTRKRNGRIYLNVDEVELDLRPQKVVFDFENLCNGDKEQSDKLNQWLNMHWKQVFNELHFVFAKALGKVGRTVVNGPFKQIPYLDLFLK